MHFAGLKKRSLHEPGGSWGGEEISTANMSEARDPDFMKDLTQTQKGEKKKKGGRTKSTTTFRFSLLKG